MIPAPPSSPFGSAFAQAPVQKVAERKLTKDELLGRIEFIKPMLDKLGLNGLQGSPVYQNYKTQFDDYNNQLRALGVTPNAPPATK